VELPNCPAVACILTATHKGGDWLLRMLNRDGKTYTNLLSSGHHQGRFANSFMYSSNSKVVVSDARPTGTGTGERIWTLSKIRGRVRSSSSSPSRTSATNKSTSLDELGPSSLLIPRCAYGASKRVIQPYIVSWSDHQKPCRSLGLELKEGHNEAASRASYLASPKISAVLFVTRVCWFLQVCRNDGHTGCQLIILQQWIPGSTKPQDVLLKNE
jgi:hypothetical protein